MNDSSPLLLDTQIWIWLCSGEKKLLNTPLLHQIELSSKKSALLISIFSVWEFSMLLAKKRISTSLTPHEWIQMGIEKFGITVAEMTPTIAIESCCLPGSFHGDPADRIIMATALEHKATLATQDRKIIDYATKNNIPTISI